MADVPDFYDRVQYKNIFTVEKAVNDEWQPVEVEFIKPEVRIK